MFESQPNNWFDPQKIIRGDASYFGFHRGYTFVRNERDFHLWLNPPPLRSGTHAHSETRGTCPKLPEESKLVTIPVK